MDILTKATICLSDYAASLPSSTIVFWLRLVCLLTLPVVFAAWTFNRGYRSVFIQAVAGVFGVLLALSLPLQHVHINSGMARLWFLTLAILVVTFIPVALPQLLLPTFQAQRRLRKALVFAIATIVVANFLWG